MDDPDYLAWLARVEAGLETKHIRSPEGETFLVDARQVVPVGWTTVVNITKRDTRPYAH